jgi:hypothetical protein
MATAPFPVNPVLTGVAMAYRNGRMIADDICPRRPIGGESFKWYKHEIGAKLTVPDTRVGRKSIPNEVEFNLVEESASTVDYGLDDVVPVKDMDNAKTIPGFNPLSTATENMTDIIELSREVRVAGLVFGAGNYAAANKAALVGNDKWSDYVNSDPTDDIVTALDGMVMRGNVAVFGRPAWSKLSRHPQILAGVGKLNINGGIATRAEVAELFELDEILVGESYVNIAKPGQAVNRARVWGNHCALLYRDKLADFQNNRPTFSLTAQWGGRIAGDMPEPKVGLRGSVRVRVGEAVRELVIANDLGFLFQDVV